MVTMQVLCTRTSSKKYSLYLSQRGALNLAYISVSPFGGICVNLISFSTKIAGMADRLTDHSATLHAR